MGGKQTKRCPNGPGTSRAPALFRPDILEIVDFQAKIGIIRAFWLRKDLLDKKLPLVLIHGWGCGAGYFKNMNPLLARDRAILFIDLPGFGESERVEIGINPEEAWPDSLQEIITALIPGKCFVGAHSLGGWMSSLMSLKDGMKEKIEGLILLDPAGFNTRELKGKGCFEKMFDSFLGWFSDTFNDVGEYGLIQWLPRYLEEKVMTDRHASMDCLGTDGLNYIVKVNQITPPSGDHAFMKVWKPRTFVPANPLTPIIQAKAKNFPKNVLFIWGADSYLDNAKGDMLQEFFEQDESLDTKIESTYVHGEEGNLAGHNFPASHGEDTAKLVNKFIAQVEGGTF